MCEEFAYELWDFNQKDGMECEETEELIVHLNDIKGCRAAETVLGSVMSWISVNIV